MDRKLRVGITHGDINGVGYEVILKTFEDTGMFELCTPILYGSPKVATYQKKALELQTGFQVINHASQAQDGRLNLISCFDEEVKIEFGVPSIESGTAALLSLERALADYEDGLFDVLVTAPINKHTIQSETFHFPGHTEYIEEKVGEGQQALMILMQDTLRVALVTTHIPIKDISQTITKDLIKEKATILFNTLKQDFSINNPRIAVLSLNPHAGDNCLIGMEEHDKIIPAIQELTAEGVQCFGPYPADGFFGSGSYTHFDGILAMYHDQGLAPFKALAMDAGVNYTAGLPIIRTSPAHGTAYDIAGKGIANEASFRQAIYSAIDIYRNRVNDEYAHRNPLHKLYHERRDDSDKLKLDQEA